MNKETILMYLPLLKRQHIINFAKKEGISLTNDEVDTIYSVIKTNARDLLNGNYSSLEQHKSKLNEQTYQTIIRLINQYKSMIN